MVREGEGGKGGEKEGREKRERRERRRRVMVYNNETYLTVHWGLVQ